jgi:hypothetical protein
MLVHARAADDVATQTLARVDAVNAKALRDLDSRSDRAARQRKRHGSGAVDRGSSPGEAADLGKTRRL